MSGITDKRFAAAIVGLTVVLTGTEYGWETFSSLVLLRIEITRFANDSFGLRWRRARLIGRLERKEDFIL
uniref:hypothetical protein n=1 Tax=Algoriphagus sp. TaxID=1872435 RepID=UPI004048789F